MKKNNIAKLIILLLCVCCLFSGCRTSAPKSLYKSNTVEVIRDGNKTAVYDIVADKEYNYIIKRVKHSEAITEPYTTVDAETIKIDIIPHGLRVYDKAENTVFTVKQERLHGKGVRIWN